MKVLITGAGGFLGKAVTTQLLQQGQLLVDGQLQQITALLLVDHQTVSVDPATNPHELNIETKRVDLAEPSPVQEMMLFKPDMIFHFAAALTIAAERDDELAYRINIACLHHIIQNASPKLDWSLLARLQSLAMNLPGVLTT